MVAWRASKSTFQGLEMAQRCRPWLEENGCVSRTLLPFVETCVSSKAPSPSSFAPWSGSSVPPRLQLSLNLPGATRSFSSLSSVKKKQLLWMLKEQAKHSCSSSEEGRKPPGLQCF